MKNKNKITLFLRLLSLMIVISMSLVFFQSVAFAQEPPAIEAPDFGLGDDVDDEEDDLGLSGPPSLTAGDDDEDEPEPYEPEPYDEPERFIVPVSAKETGKIKSPLDRLFGKKSREV